MRDFVSSSMPDSPEIAEILGQLLAEVHSIRIHTRRMARSSYLADLNKIAKTSLRQEIWRLCDGTRSTTEIASLVGGSERSVQYFVEDAERVGLIQFVRRGYPKRVDDFDEVPGDWPQFRKTAKSRGGSERPLPPDRDAATGGPGNGQ